MEATSPLGPRTQTRITDALEQWAAQAPDRTFLAQRDGDDWRKVKLHQETLERVRRIAQALIDRQLSPDRPIVILSGNGIDHACWRWRPCRRRAVRADRAGLLAAGQGIQFSAAHLRPRRAGTGLYRERRGVRACAAVGAQRPCGARRVRVAWRAARHVVRSARQRAVTAAVDDAKQWTRRHRRAIALHLGINGTAERRHQHQRMLCSNQEMLRAVYAFLGDAPPIICDWCPWNHTAGGNHNFGLVLCNGGTLIDDGKPTPALFRATVRNLREIRAGAHRAAVLRNAHAAPAQRCRAAQTFFSQLKLLFYAAAGLGQRFWDELRDVAMDACGEEIFISTGLGATETAPFAIATGTLNAFAGMIGLPAPGMELKLSPVESKMEGRVRGPNITPGYWRDEALPLPSTRKASIVSATRWTSPIPAIRKRDSSSTAASPRTSSSRPEPGSVSDRCGQESLRRPPGSPRTSSSAVPIASS